MMRCLASRSPSCSCHSSKSSSSLYRGCFCHFDNPLGYVLVIMLSSEHRHRKPRPSFYGRAHLPVSLQETALGAPLRGCALSEGHCMELNHYGHLSPYGQDRQPERRPIGQDESRLHPAGGPLLPRP